MGLFSGTCADGALHPSPLRRYQSAGASWGHRRRHYLGDVHDHQPGGQQVRDSRCLIRSHLASSSYSDRRPSFSNFVSPRLMPTCAQIAPRGASPVCAQYRRPAWDHSSSHRNRGGGGGGTRTPHNRRQLERDCVTALSNCSSGAPTQPLTVCLGTISLSTGTGWSGVRSP